MNLLQTYENDMKSQFTSVFALNDYMNDEIDGNTILLRRKERNKLSGKQVVRLTVETDSRL